MSSINSISGGGQSSMMSGMRPPDPSKMVDKLFAIADTTSKGYITKSDLQSAMSQTSGSGSSKSVDEIFKKIDTNGNGQITKEEMTSGMKSLTGSLQGQIHKTGRGGPPPGAHPPPPSSSSSDSTSSATNTYEAADTNQDGTVSQKEQISYDFLKQSISSAQAYSTSSNTSQAASETTSSTSGTAASETSSTSAASATATDSDAKIMKQLSNLMHAYGNTHSSSNSSGLSVNA